MPSLPLRIASYFDLAARYGDALRRAWRHRRELETPRRLSHEAQFLPAALALQETPVSPAPRAAIWLLSAFAAAALLWSFFGRLDVVATAPGKVVPSSRSKTIQPLEAATVRAIHVADGRAVKEGEVLIELDATTAQADQDRLASDLGMARLQVARGKALLAALDSGRAPRLSRPPGVDLTVWKESSLLVEGQWGEYSAKTALFGTEIARREAERLSTVELVRKLERTVPIAAQVAADYQGLAAQELVPKHEALDRERARLEQEGDLAVQRSRLREIEEGQRQAEAQKTQLTAETRRASLDSVNEGLQKAASLEQELLKAQARGKWMRLLSPVDGTVQQLAVHTVGGVVTPAQPVMVIVPKDSALEVEAFVDNKDIGFVRAGMDVEVKFETFQYTKYGTIHGKVLSVSDDAIQDEKRGLVYSARVRLDRSWIDVGGKNLNLSPGMAVTAEIKTDRRRVIEYFLSPLLQYANESLRER